MEMQQIPQDKGGQLGEEEAGAPTIRSAAEEEAPYLYSKLKNPSEDIYQEPYPDSKSKPGKQHPRKVYVHHVVCAVLSLLCMILLLAVIILSMKISAQPTPCPEGRISDNKAVDSKAPRCSFESCQAQFPKSLFRMYNCQQCEKGWLAFNTSCYFLSKQKKSWEDSRTYCKANGGDLAVIPDQNVQNFLSAKGVVMYWIGLRNNGSDWTWINNSTLGNSYWAKDGWNGDCGILNGGSPLEDNWTKRPCSQISYCICEQQHPPFMATSAIH